MNNVIPFQQRRNKGVCPKCADGLSKAPIGILVGLEICSTCKDKYARAEELHEMIDSVLGSIQSPSIIKAFDSAMDAYDGDMSSKVIENRMKNLLKEINKLKPSNEKELAMEYFNLYIWKTVNPQHKF